MTFKLGVSKAEHGDQPVDNDNGRRGAKSALTGDFLTYNVKFKICMLIRFTISSSYLTLTFEQQVCSIFEITVFPAIT